MNPGATVIGRRQWAAARSFGHTTTKQDEAAQARTQGCQVYRPAPRLVVVALQLHLDDDAEDRGAGGGERDDQVGAILGRLDVR
ncbi:hypothetical protein [Nocardia abscessus]|uniref:hypothetical protein n=1 Tax=Nocardia abscessus TaxID=120957 RepID=UPI002455A9FE|nr:hypothetical protein [Nocardia abscessus]